MAKKIVIEEADNGFVILVTSEGNQTVYNSTKMLIAKDVESLLEVVRLNV